MSSSSAAFLKNLVGGDSSAPGAAAQKTSLNIVLSIASILSLVLLGLIITQIVRATSGQGATATDAISISIYVLIALTALAWIIYYVYKTKLDKANAVGSDSAAASFKSAAGGAGGARGMSLQQQGSADVPTGLAQSSVAQSSDIGSALASTAQQAIAGGAGAGGPGGARASVVEQLRGIARNPQLQQAARTLAGTNPVAQRVVGTATGIASAL